MKTLPKDLPDFSDEQLMAYLNSFDRELDRLDEVLNDLSDTFELIDTGRYVPLQGKGKI